MGTISTAKSGRMFHFSTVVVVVAIFIMFTPLIRFFSTLVTHFWCTFGPHFVVLLFICEFARSRVAAGLRARSWSCSSCL